jgi:hypothetical protein
VTDWAPTWRVEIDWAGDGTWTDISSTTIDDEEHGRVRSVEWQRGKSGPWGHYEAGTATVVLDNRDRNLEPDYVDSDYYPNVRPMRRIRISSTWDGGDASVITGVVEGWPPAWDESGSEATITVPVSDAFLVFGGARLPSSVHELEQLAAGPEAWWRLGETSGHFGGDSSGHDHHGEYEGGATFDTRNSLIWGDDDPAILLAGDNLLRIPTGDQVLDDWDFTVVGWIDVPDGELTHNGTIYLQQSDRSIGMAVTYIFVGYTVMGGEPYVSVQGIIEGTSLFEGFYRASLSVLAPGIHRIAAYFPPEGATLPDDLRVWIDEDELAGDEHSLLPTMPPFPSSMIYTQIGPAEATLDEVAIYTRALTDDEHAAQYQAATTPWEGDLSGERVEKLLALIGVGGDQVDIDPGRSVLQRTELSGVLLEPLQAIEESEDGALFATRDGVIRFRDRDAPYDDPRSNTVQVVFGDDWRDGDEVPYTVVEPVYDVSSIVNSVEARRTGGAAYTVEDETSIVDDGYGYRSASLSLLVLDDRDVIDAAGVLVAERAKPKLRFRKITVAPSVNPDVLWPIVLELDIGDRVAFRKRPPGGGDPVDVDAIIVGVAGRAPAGHCTIDFTLEPPPLDPFAWADDVDGSGPGLGWADDDGTGGGAWTR